MRPPVAALVCLCLVLAGCGTLAPAGDDAGGPTVNPALDDTPTAAPTPARWAGPPGVAADGTVGQSFLLEAHGEVLSNRSVTVRRDLTVRLANGTVVREQVLVSRAAGGSQYVETRGSEFPFELPDNRSFDGARWSNDSLAVSRRPYTNGTVSTSVRGPSASGFLDVDRAGVSVLDSTLERFDLVYAGGTVVAGERLHVLRAAPDQRPQPYTANVSVGVLVTDAGVVREVTVRYRDTRYGPQARTATVAVTITVTNVSETTVPRPPWVNETLAGTNGSRDADSSLAADRLPRQSLSARTRPDS